MKRHLLSALTVFCLFLLGQTALAQGTYNMCSAPAVVTDTSGTLYDSGGPNGQYVDNENCTLLIQPTCATSITLTFQSFETESNFDYLYIYDGTTVTAPLLVTGNGQSIPSPSVVTATSGSMLIVWRSDVSIVFDGFEVSWTSVIAPSVAPSAAFSVSTLTPPLNANVQFTDNSTGGPTGWLWEFGDGDTARRQNPVHSYDTPGQYTVMFVAFTCNESDTSYVTVDVQAAPEILVDPISGFTGTADCGDTLTFQMTVTNVQGGELVYNADGSSVGQLRVLAMTYGADMFSEFPSTIAAINQFFSGYTLTQTGTIDPNVLSGLLIGKNVLLIPEQETGDPAVWATLAPVIQNYVNNGGSVIFLGSYSSSSQCMFNTGIFSGTFDDDVVGTTMTVITNQHPITTGLGATFNAPSATYAMNISNSDKVQLVRNSTNKDIVSYRMYGRGKAIFIAFDYFNRITETSRIIANAVQWAGINALPSWVGLSQNNGNLTAATTDTITVSLYATGLPAGTYYANIGVASNDIVSGTVNVPCTLTINNPIPIIRLSQTCVDIGSVIQNQVATDTFMLYNDGCTNLNVSSIASNNSNFTLSSSSATILPGASAAIVVTYSNGTLGPDNGTIDVLNDDVDTTICLTANVLPAPVLTPSTTSVVQAIPACGATATSTFTIENTGVAGASDLFLSLGSLPAWVTASIDNDTLPVGATATVTLTFNSGTFAGGNQNTTLAIASNDPLNPSYQMPITMGVDFNPCLSYTFTSNSCTGITNFTTQSINTPTTYAWDFGDGETSTQQNPTHGFPSNGTYNVTVIGCNGSGCDTVTQSVNVVITGPTGISCLPSTQAYCAVCGIGIFRVQLRNIDNVSNDAIDGYQNYTCTDTTTLETNTPYTLTVTTGTSYVETVRAWLDMNNDGSLDPVTELVFADSAVLQTHTGTIQLSNSVVTGQPLRLRVAADYSGNPTPEPCLDLQFGQVEDYSVFVTFGSSVSDLTSSTQFVVYPNPFGSATNIEYNLKNGSVVSVEVFNLIGERVTDFAVNERQFAGKHTYRFEPTASGVYYVKLTVDGATTMQKIVKM